MKIKLIGAVLGLLLLSVSAQARLGMTLKECQDKYGPDTITNNRLYGEIHNFKVNSIDVHIVFRNDVAVVVSYHREGGIDQTELEGMLDKNAQGGTWTSPETQGSGKAEYTLWYAEKRNVETNTMEWIARAEYDPNGPAAGTITFCTKAEWFEKEQEKVHDGL